MLLNNIIWRSIQGIGQQVLNFVVGIILARLLSPNEFGQIGILLFFIAISQSFIDSGLGVSLVRQENIDEHDVNTVFTFNVFTSFAIYVILFLISPLIADFYEQPILSILLKVLSLKFIISAFSITFYALLRRERKLKYITTSTLLATLISSLVAIAMAYNNYGVWSIVARQILMSFILLIGYYYFIPKLPKLNFLKSRFKILFSFGGKLLFSDIIKRVFENINSIVIGKVLSVADVGLFNRADSLQKIPILAINTSIGEGAAPTIYKMQSNIDSLMSSSRLVLQLSYVLSIPICIVLFVFPKEITIILLTEKWIGIVELLKLFAVAGLFYPFIYFSKLIFKAVGKSSLILKSETISRIFMFFSLFLIFIWGTKGLIIGIIMTNIVQTLLNMSYLKNEISYLYKMLFVDFFKPFLVSLLSIVFYVFFNQYDYENITVKLLIMFLGGLITFLLSIYFIYGNDYKNILKILKK